MSMQGGSHRSVEAETRVWEMMHRAFTVVFVSGLRTPCKGKVSMSRAEKRANGPSRCKFKFFRWSWQFLYMVFELLYAKGWLLAPSRSGGGRASSDGRSPWLPAPWFISAHSLPRAQLDAAPSCWVGTVPGANPKLAFGQNCLMAACDICVLQTCPWSWQNCHGIDTHGISTHGMLFPSLYLFLF